MKLFKGKIDIGGLSKDILSKIDDSKFTDQEKAEANKDVLRTSIEFYKLTLNENTERSKTRRNISHVLLINTVVLFWICVILNFKGVDITKVLELTTAFKMGWAFISVIGFYFGVHLLRTYQNKK